jgi:hypothetical protein
VLSVASLLGGHALGWWDGTLLYEYFSSLFVQANIVAFLFSFYLYFKGRAAAKVCKRVWCRSEHVRRRRAVSCTPSGLARS